MFLEQILTGMTPNRFLFIFSFLFFLFLFLYLFLIGQMNIVPAVEHSGIIVWVWVHRELKAL